MVSAFSLKYIFSDKLSSAAAAARHIFLSLEISLCSLGRAARLADRANAVPKRAFGGLQQGGFQGQAQEERGKKKPLL
jgi:hypothetical protein